MKLVSGPGSPTTGACWMSAVNWYVYSGREKFCWSDHPDCVDPVIRSLCIKLNDWCGDGEREELIGPHLFAPVGTNIGPEMTERRAYAVGNWTFREIFPEALEAAGLYDEARNLRDLPEIDSLDTFVAAADRAAEAARAAWAAWAAEAAWAAAAARAAVAARAAEAAGAAGAARAAVAAADAAEAARVAWAGGAAGAAAVRKDVLNLILELCAMGQQTEEELRPCRTKEATLECIDTGRFPEEVAGE